jgi:hypothetical protein
MRNANPEELHEAAAGAMLALVPVYHHDDN